MNSLEALELLVMPDDVYDREIRKLGLENNRFLPYETIKRDLEVLEILKKHSSRLDDEDWNSNIFNGIDYEDLDEKEAKIIKEWLNDK